MVTIPRCRRRHCGGQILLFSQRPTLADPRELVATCILCGDRPGDRAPHVATVADNTILTRDRLTWRKERHRAAFKVAAH